MSWYHFWTDRVFGGWNRYVERFRPWTRYRTARLFKVVLVIALIGVAFGWRWNESPIDALVELPRSAIDSAFSTGQNLPLILQLAVALIINMLIFVGIFWLLSRRDRHLLPRRRRDEVQRRLGPGSGARPRQREHGLPREAGGDRESRRVRAERDLAVGSAGNGQDVDGRSRRRRDGASVRVRRSGRVHQHVLRDRRAQGQAAVPQAAQARPALRRRDRLLRRGRHTGQPRWRGRRRPTAPCGDISVQPWVQRDQLCVLVGHHRVAARSSWTACRRRTTADVGAS